MIVAVSISAASSPAGNRLIQEGEERHLFSGVFELARHLERGDPAERVAGQEVGAGGL